MNLGLYTNGFTPGDMVIIDMPCASFDGMETEVLRPRPMDILGSDEVLVRNPLDLAWVLKLHKGFLVKAGEDCSAGSFAASAAGYTPVSAGVVIR